MASKRREPPIVVIIIGIPPRPIDVHVVKLCVGQMAWGTEIRIRIRMVRISVGPFVSQSIVIALVNAQARGIK